MAYGSGLKGGTGWNQAVGAFEIDAVAEGDAIQRIQLRVWERGAGETLGCGTGASAAAVAAVADVPARELSSKFWWDLAAASAVLGDATAAHEFAQSAARTFCDDALTMGPDLAESYSRLPWHIATFAYLAGREVSFRLAD